MPAWPPPAGISETDWGQTPPAVQARLAQALAAEREPAEDEASQTALRQLRRRLEAVLAPEDILPTIVTTLVNRLRLPYAAIALKRVGSPAFEVAASAGATAPPAVPAEEELYTLPLLHNMEIVGRLIIQPRPQPDTLTATEQTWLIDIARQAGTAAYLVRLTADLRRTRERLVLAREEERRRLRRDLHDSIGPTLAALNLKAGALRTLITRDPPAAAQQMTELREQIRLVITDIRRVVYNLRPPALDELGMVPAIREQAAQFSSEDLQVSVEAPEQLPSLPAAVEVAAYRIVLEALTNVARHAHARHCHIHIYLEAGLRVEVVDDGLGLPPQPAVGVGIASMRERATELGGTCVMAPVPGGGTLVLAHLPLDLGGPGADPQWD